jgi:hypothetical protein
MYHALDTPAKQQSRQLEAVSSPGVVDFSGSRGHQPSFLTQGEYLPRPPPVSLRTIDASLTRQSLTDIAFIASARRAPPVITAPARRGLAIA